MTVTSRKPTYLIRWVQCTVGLLACYLSLAFLPNAPVHAQGRAVQRLDDSASPAARLTVSPRWLFDSGNETLSDEQTNALVAELRAVEYRLATARFTGKQADIYLRLENPVRGLRVPSGMRLQWTTRGKMRPGVLFSGDRVLVFRGIVSEPRMTEFFDFTIQIDGRHFDGGLEFQPIFEIETVN